MYIRRYKKSLDINAIFLSKEIRTNLLDKINLIKDSRDLQAKRYEIDLLELFIRYLNAEVSDEYLKNHFEDLSSLKIKRNNFSDIDLSPIELRILLNIASYSKDFKNIDRLEVFEKCKNQNKDPIVKLLAYNNFSNFYVINKDYQDALKISNEGINYSRNSSYIDGLIYLHFINFLVSYRANKNYEEALLATKVLLKNNLNPELNMLVNRNINNILG